jgi:hypothetical protein
VTDIPIGTYPGCSQRVLATVLLLCDDGADCSEMMELGRKGEVGRLGWVLALHRDVDHGLESWWMYGI